MSVAGYLSFLSKFPSRWTTIVLSSKAYQRTTHCARKPRRRTHPEADKTYAAAAFAVSFLLLLVDGAKEGRQEGKEGLKEGRVK